jgi:hypothetical protein
MRAARSDARRSAFGQILDKESLPRLPEGETI